MLSDDSLTNLIALNAATAKHQPKTKQGRFTSVKGAGIALPGGTASAKLDYLTGMTSKLKDPAERRYATARAKQIATGTPRKAGMSADYGIPKARARALEGVLAKVAKSATAKGLT